MFKEKVISYFDGVVNVAEIVGVNHSAVSQWGEIIPEKHAFALEKHTKGKLKHDPTLYKRATKASNSSTQPQDTNPEVV